MLIYDLEEQNTYNKNWMKAMENAVFTLRDGGTYMGHNFGPVKTFEQLYLRMLKYSPHVISCEETFKKIYWGEYRKWNK